jgi:hypothetical protein
MSGAREGVFERGNHVVDYWLAHCEGFKLGKAQVTAVLCDRHTGHARMLFVKSGAGRPHTLSARAIAAVNPFNKVLYLEPRTPRRRMQSAGRVALAIARQLRLRAAAGLRISVLCSRDGVVWLCPRLRAGAWTTVFFLRKRYSEAALWLAPRVAAGLRAIVSLTNAVVEDVRRRRSAER